MEETGMAIMGTGVAEGNNKGIEAAKRAVSSPLLEDLSINGARGVLVNLTGGEDLTMEEVDGAMTYIQAEAHQDANIIFGAVIEKRMKDRLMVTVIATGFPKGEKGLSHELINIAPPQVKGFAKPDLDTPTFIRKERESLAIEKVSRRMKIAEDPESEYEIPTFLRKKAD
jgi:cell division protein FtsZ